MLHSLKRFDKSEVAKQRVNIIKFYEEYGEKATKEAFGADRKLISSWKKRLSDCNGRLDGLAPYSTRPHTVRRSVVHIKIITFIRDMRKKHPRLGKEKIKVLLDKYCRKMRIKTTSESTVGNIIKRHKFFYQKSGRAYHNPNTKWALNSRKRVKRLRVKHPPKPKDFGHILADTVERTTDGIKDYFYSAIDAKLKFVVTLNYKRLNSRNMKDFYKRFKTVYPCVIKTWQTDNGPENLGEFDEELKKDSIPHYFSYPYCPKINTYIERYNRTLQEEFINNHLDIIDDKELFSKELADYLIFYNTERPHKTLGLKSPIDYLIEKGGMSQKSLTYTLL